MLPSLPLLPPSLFLPPPSRSCLPLHHLPHPPNRCAARPPSFPSSTFSKVTVAPIVALLPRRHSLLQAVLSLTFASRLSTPQVVSCFSRDMEMLTLGPALSVQVTTSLPPPPPPPPLSQHCSLPRIHTLLSLQRQRLCPFPAPGIPKPLVLPRHFNPLPPSHSPAQGRRCFQPHAHGRRS